MSIKKKERKKEKKNASPPDPPPPPTPAKRLPWSLFRVELTGTHAGRLHPPPPHPSFKLESSVSVLCVAQSLSRLPSHVVVCQRVRTLCPPPPPSQQHYQEDAIDEKEIVVLFFLFANYDNLLFSTPPTQCGDIYYHWMFLVEALVITT